MSAITVILNRAQQGDPHAAEELLPLVYDELRKLAAAKMANESRDTGCSPQGWFTSRSERPPSQIVRLNTRSLAVIW